jgi:thiol-disulfide isomerase/thioredoxin
MLLAILALRVDLGQKEWNQLNSATNSPPAFILAYVPWCGHCRALFPSWRKLVVDFESDADVIIASLNCSAYETLCRTMDVRGFPTFFTLYRGALRRAALLERTYTAFATEVRRLRDAHRGQFAFRAQMARMSYPSFVFRLSPTDERSRNIAIRASRLAGTGRFFFDVLEDSESPTVAVFLSRNRSVVMEEQFSYDAVSAFIGDNLVVPFGSWEWADIANMTRLFALHYPLTKHDEVVEWAARNEKAVVFGSLKVLRKRRCAKLFRIRQTALPAVVFIRGRRFTVVEAANAPALDDFLKAHREERVRMESFDPHAEGGILDVVLDSLRAANGRVVAVVVLAVVGCLTYGWIRQKLSSYWKQD